MKRLLILGVAVGAAIAAGIAIAATSDSGGSGKSGGATVSARQISGTGKVLVDAKGRALYRSDQERNGMVRCDGACLSFWQPLTVSGTPSKSGSIPGALAVVRRPDGRRQVTFNGKLLYSFKLDKPGKVTGDGFKDAFGSQKFTWHVVRLTAARTSPSTPTPTNTIPGY